MLTKFTQTRPAGCRFNGPRRVCDFRPLEPAQLQPVLDNASVTACWIKPLDANELILEAAGRDALMHAASATGRARPSTNGLRANSA